MLSRSEAFEHRQRQNNEENLEESYHSNLNKEYFSDDQQEIFFQT